MSWTEDTFVQLKACSSIAQLQTHEYSQCSREAAAHFMYSHINTEVRALKFQKSHIQHTVWI